MNDDTIRMARESKLDIYGLGCPHDQFIEKVKAFEALVRADEREAMVAEATKMGLAMKNEEPFEDLVRDIANDRSRSNT